MRGVATVMSAALAVGTTVHVQEPPRFDAVSSRPARDGANPRLGPQPGGRFVMTNLPVVRLIRAAHAEIVADVVGAPSWVASDRYDYEFTLTFAASPGTAAGVPDAADDRPSLLAARQEQLALRLAAGRAPLDVLVIEHIERPEAN